MQNHAIQWALSSILMAFNYALLICVFRIKKNIQHRALDWWNAISRKTQKNKITTTKRRKLRTTKFHYNLIFNLHFKCHCCVSNWQTKLKQKKNCQKIFLLYFYANGHAAMLYTHFYLFRLLWRVCTLLNFSRHI